MQLFYAEKIEGKTAFLSETESRHCLKVLRKKEGDAVQVTDGKGNCFEGQLFLVKKRLAAVGKLAVVDQQEQRYPLVSLSVAPTKNNSRLEWLLEKAVEIGIDELQPFVSKHSERRKINERRLGDIALSAMKQSGRYRLPEIQPLVKLEDLLQTDVDEKVLNLVGSQSAESDISEIDLIGKDKIRIFIGPEGDFSEEEWSVMHQKSFVFVNLGNFRLRTETAGIVGVTLINSLINKI